MMIIYYIACFVLGFRILQLLIAGINVWCREKYKQSDNYTDWVSILIPARNEEKNIAFLLSNLQQQNYSHIEILIFDDESTDNTAKIVSQFAQADKRIRLITSSGLPKGWLGKNFACHTLATQARGKYFLFLDADVRIAKDIIPQTMYQMKKHCLKLVSIFPKQQTMTTGECLTVPLMNYILLSLLTLMSVRKSCFSSMSAANGQYMFFDGIFYRKIWPHEKMKSQRVEDIAIARDIKKQKRKIACWLGNEEITCRMYHSFQEAVNGFSKNIIVFFGNSYFLAVVFWLTTTFGFLPVCFIFKVKIIVLYFLSIILIRVSVSYISGQSILKNILLLIPQQLVLGWIIIQAIKNKIKKEYIWKERNLGLL